MIVFMLKNVRCIYFILFLVQPQVWQLQETMASAMGKPESIYF